MLTKTANVLEGLIDNRLNPILVRELRQMVRSRFVVTMLNLYIGVLVIVCLSMVAFASVSQLESMGQGLFNVLSAIMGASCFFVVVIYTGTVTASERINSDLMFSSALKPRQIVWGKFLSGLILSLLLFSAVFPFFTLAYLLRGLDLFTFLDRVYWIFLMIHTMNAFVIFVSSTVRTTVQAIFVGLGAFILFFPAFQMLFGALYAFGMYGGAMSFGFGGFDWAFYVTLTLISLSMIGFFLIAAIVVISPPASNRMVPMRLYITAWVILSFLYLLICDVFSGWSSVDFEKMVSTWCVLQGWFLVVSIPFISSERDSWSFRIRNTIPRVVLFRLILFPFYTGVACGYLWWLLYAGAVTVIYATMGELITSHYSDYIINLCCAFLFVFDFFFTAVLLRTSVWPKKITPGKTWALAVIMCSITTLGTALFYSLLTMNNQGMYFLEGYDDNILSVLNPFVLMFNLQSSSGLALQSFGALAWTAVLVLFFIPWFFYRLAQFSPEPTQEEREILKAVAKGRSAFDANATDAEVAESTY